jgi:hypothetical protein
MLNEMFSVISTEGAAPSLKVNFSTGIKNEISPLLSSLDQKNMIH